MTEQEFNQKFLDKLTQIVGQLFLIAIIQFFGFIGIGIVLWMKLK